MYSYIWGEIVKNLRVSESFLSDMNSSKVNLRKILHLTGIKKKCTDYQTSLQAGHPHLLITCSRKSHLQVVEPGSSYSIEPVDHLLQEKAKQNKQSIKKHSLSDNATCCNSRSPSVHFMHSDMGVKSHQLHMWRQRRYLLYRGKCSWEHRSSVDAAALSIPPPQNKSDGDSERTQWTRLQ